jgi:4-amino-4-deoxy-L-arabinose transferase-like glycosyltransferase
VNGPPTPPLSPRRVDFGEGPRPLLERLGLGTGPPDARFGWLIVIALLAVYAVCFVAFYPTVPTNEDEAMYLRQTRLLLEGRSTITKTDPFTGEESVEHPSTYVPGTAMLMAPFVDAWGDRAAFVAPFLSLLAAVVFTGLWLQADGRSPVFAALLLGFPPFLVLGRVCMSDLPSAAVVSLGLWLFWRGLDRGAPWWLASGFAAGASTVFRATNPLVFLPLFAGTVLRRDWRAGYLVMGGLLGIGVRLLAVHYYFGEPFFERARYYYSPESIMERVPLYLLGLLVFVPGGLAFALAYRGRRRAEVLVTPLLFVGVYLLQLWSTVETGLAKRLVLALRYFIPLLPLLCFAMAESLPRLWKTLRGRLSAPSQRRAERERVGTSGDGAVEPLAGDHPRRDRPPRRGRGPRHEPGRHTETPATARQNLPAPVAKGRFERGPPDPRRATR